MSFSALPGPSGSGSWYASPEYTSRSRASAIRRISTYSRVRASCLANRSPCQPSATCGPDVPIPSSIRPPDSWSSVAAVIAVIAGERPGIWKIAEPIRICFVWAASQASTVAASEPYASAAHTEWNPAASASWTSSSWSEAFMPRPQ